MTFQHEVVSCREERRTDDCIPVDQFSGTYGTERVLEKTTRVSLTQALEIPSAACSSAGCFIEAVHSKTLLLVVTSCQRSLVRKREGSIHPRPASLHRSLLPGSRQRYPFPFQPSLSDSRSNMKSKGMYLVEIFCRMTLCKACFVFFFGRSGISTF